MQWRITKERLHMRLTLPRLKNKACHMTISLNPINPLTTEDAYRRAIIYGVHFALKKGAKGAF